MTSQIFGKIEILYVFYKYLIPLIKFLKQRCDVKAVVNEDRRVTLSLPNFHPVSSLFRAL